VPEQFAQFAKAIAEVEPVEVLAGGDEAQSAARQWLSGISNVRFWDIPTNDAWCRDHGPTFLQGAAQRPPLLLDWTYNAWGNKYPPYDHDDAVPARIAEGIGYQRQAPPLVLEGGAIDGNGEGLVMTTASCLLNANRNPGRSRAEVERILRDFLGAQAILWLPRGELAGDDTDGHIDQLARFVGPRTVVSAMSPDACADDAPALQANLEYLRNWTDDRGQHLEVVELPLPAPKYFGSHRLPASYCNFYIANLVVLVPQFDDPRDATALETLQQLFPDRHVRGLPALDLVWGLGSFHCLTQQQPQPDDEVEK
jgi:agmatine deiminase